MGRDLRPQRTPLQSKRSKRCPECKHILIKPEQKASSTRFKIKLVASNYLPSIEVYRRPPTTLLSSRLAVVGTPNVRRTPRTAPGRSVNDVQGVEDEPLRPGRTYTFELGFTNPLFEPIQVKIAIARPGSQSLDIEGPPAYAVNIPSPHFPISAFAEEWEYEEEEMMGDEEEGGDGGTARKKKKGGAGIVERKMNRTTVLLEVAVGKDTIGPINVSNQHVVGIGTDDIWGTGEHVGDLHLSERGRECTSSATAQVSRQGSDGRAGGGGRQVILVLDVVQPWDSRSETCRCGRQ